MNDRSSISVVIPTCNRRESLLRLLRSLEHSTHPIQEVIIIDSSDEVLSEEGFFKSPLPVRYFTSERSVCIQRNKGIFEAKGEWIFLCDDDLEVPADYLSRLTLHIEANPDAGCVTGNVLQNNGKGNTWTDQYPMTSSLDLLARFIFQLSIWGNIKIQRPNFLIRLIKGYYDRNGNHLSKAGWPVITDFSGIFFRTPFYGLGASLVRKDWLMNSTYDEVLDPHGIGDNYGVASGFPKEGIHVVNDAYVYHYRASENRLFRADLYYRRLLALDYFLKTKKELSHINRLWFIWSLLGSTILLLSPRNLSMLKVNLKLIYKIIVGDNPYLQKKKSGGKITIPEL